MGQFQFGMVKLSGIRSEPDGDAYGVERTCYEKIPSGRPPALLKNHWIEYRSTPPILWGR